MAMFSPSPTLPWGPVPWPPPCRAGSHRGPVGTSTPGQGCFARSYSTPLGSGTSLGRPNQFGEARPWSRQPGGLGRWQGRDPQPGVPLQHPVYPRGAGPGCLGTRMTPRPPEPVPGCLRPPHPSPPWFRAAAVPRGAATGSGVSVSPLSSLPAFSSLVFQAQIGKCGGSELGPSQLPLATAPATPWLLRPLAPSFLLSSLFALVGSPEGPSLPRSPLAGGLGVCGMPCPKAPAQRGRAALGPRVLDGLVLGGMRPRLPASPVTNFSSFLATHDPAEPQCCPSPPLGEDGVWAGAPRPPVPILRILLGFASAWRLLPGTSAST